MVEQIVRLSKNFKRAHLALTALLALLVGLLSLGGVWKAVAWHPNTEPPDAIVKRYVMAYNARDYAAVYDLLSDEDRQRRSREAYLRENGSFSGLVLQLAYRLTSYTEFQVIHTTVQGDTATVLMTLKV